MSLDDRSKRLNTLISEENQHYDTAITYFAARRKAIDTMFQAKYRIQSQQIINRINHHIHNYTSYIYNQIKAGVNGTNITNYSLAAGGASNALRSANTQWTAPTRKLFENIVSNSSSAVPENLDSLLGYGFESYLTSALQGDGFIWQALNIAASSSNNLINEFFSTGKLISSSAITKGSKFISSDIMLGPSSQIGLKTVQNGRRKQLVTANTNIAIELPELLDLSQVTSGPDSTINKMISQLEYYGFSLKVYSYADSLSRSFKSSSPMKEYLAQEYRASYPRTWSSVYASNYSSFFLSKYLINLVGPTNVAMIYNDGLVWMDDFLEARSLYMRIQVSTSGKLQDATQERGGGKEIHFPAAPVPSPSIYLRKRGTEKTFKPIYRKAANGGIIGIYTRTTVKES